MEPAETPIDYSKLARYKLNMGKFQVVKVEQGLFGPRFHINLGNSVTITVEAPVKSDVKRGDWLTLYTEVLAPNADTGSTSVQ